MAKGRVSQAKDEEPAIDGRTLRSARNQELIVQAVYELVRDGQSQPSVEEIAARAGVGTRTVFRQFQDLETLYRRLAERLQREIVAELEPLAFSGVLDDDVRLMVARRARIYERMLPFRRSLRLARQQSPFLHEQSARLAQLFRAALDAVVLPHFGRRGGEIIEALDVLLSVEAWERLREEQGLSARRAAQVLEAAALTLAAAARR